MSPAEVLTRIHECAIVPVVVLDDPDQVDPLIDALTAGGISCAEFTLRTAAGMAAIRRAARRSDFLVGAGTVLTAAQAEEAIDAGAQFIVSPGFAPEVVGLAVARDVTVLPGIATPSELQAAVNTGVTTVKLFPAAQLGGLALIDAFAGPFPHVRFLPSGGITPGSARDYLAHPAVTAIGASWMVARADIAAGHFDRVEELARQAMAVVVESRGSESRDV